MEKVLRASIAVALVLLGISIGGWLEQSRLVQAWVHYQAMAAAMSFVEHELHVPVYVRRLGESEEDFRRRLPPTGDEQEIMEAKAPDGSLVYVYYVPLDRAKRVKVRLSV